MSISGINSGSSNRPDFSQIQQSIFDKADNNGDGSIDSSEFDTMIQDSPRLTKALSSLVSNADGSKPTPDQIFKAVDTDGDGKISVAEVKGAMKAAHAHMHHGHHAGGPPPPSDDDGSDSSNPSTGTISSTISQIFKLLDTDGDGQVSSTELSTAMSSLSATAGKASDSSASADPTTTADKTAASAQTASLQALLQQLMQQIQQQQAAYTQSGNAPGVSGVPSFFEASA